MIILSNVIFAILFAIWVAGAFSTADDLAWYFMNIPFILDALLSLAIIFFWPIFKLYFLIRNLYKKLKRKW